MLLLEGGIGESVRHLHAETSEVTEEGDAPLDLLPPHPQDMSLPICPEECRLCLALHLRLTDAYLLHAVETAEIGLEAELLRPADASLLDAGDGPLLLGAGESRPVSLAGKLVVVPIGLAELSLELSREVARDALLYRAEGLPRSCGDRLSLPGIPLCLL